ncbi:hypothetical protein ONJ95_26695, partial [Salmonella enterica subsp. enterica serovar Virginia]|nr:hypothetical protein [Salmonella enterica subsp. enterica serovar Virginia]
QYWHRLISHPALHVPTARLYDALSPRRNPLTASLRAGLAKARQRPKSPEIKNDIRLYRQELRDASYHFQGDANDEQLSVTPLVG